MFTELKEGRQYSFSLELSSKDVLEQNIDEMVTFFDKSLHKEKDVKELQYIENVDIPLRVFREGNNGLRAIVVFLKEQKKLTFSKISRILGRDQRTIWCAYNSADKTKKNIKYSPEEPSINSSVFKERKLSILEAAATSLLSKYSVNETAQLLGRNKMTIWTVKRRAGLKKKANQESEKEKNKRGAK
jgi:hypothetical protein